MRDELTGLINRFSHTLAEDQGLQPPLKQVFYRKVKDIVKHSSFG
jgi:hypothetical protein